MSSIDWVVLLFTLMAMVAYGLHKGRGQTGAQSYLLADRQMPWYIVLLGIMATQASAITFLSAPGQAYTDGMRFVQYYFGLPVAMVVICITFIPIFRRLKVYTAYEYLEQRFDRRTRLLTSLLFLLSRGLSTGVSIYAPAIILSSILGWNIYITNIIMGGLLLIYTCTGGARAVAHTQKLQFLIILGSMGLAGYLVVHRLPAGLGISDALYVAGKSGKLNVITTHFDWKDKYNLWSGMIGGFFLALSYFGTDQSQVGRYIAGKDERESKLGLLMNGLVKIPMQFCILLIGALVFAFYSFQSAPVYFNTAAYNDYKAHEPQSASAEAAYYDRLRTRHENSALEVVALRKRLTQTQINAPDPAHREAQLAAREADKSLEGAIHEFQATGIELQQHRGQIAQMLYAHHYTPDKNDTNYIFLYFVKNALPVGVVGLLFAVIILASWGSISAALNSLTASSLMDVHLLGRTNVSEKDELRYGRLHTLCWGIFCICVAMFAARLGSLIEAVNILGSLFYGTILGIFLVAFYMKRVNGPMVFAAAVITEISVVAIYLLDVVSFLWLNVIGVLLVVVLCSFSYLKNKQRI